MTNGWVLGGLSRGQVADAAVVFAVDRCSRIAFLAVIYGFGFLSSFLLAYPFSERSEQTRA